MTGPAPSALLAAGGAGWESALVRVVTAPAAPVRLARRCVDVTDLVAAAAAGRAGLALVAADLPGWDADVVARLAACDVRTLVVADGPVEAERCRRLGADAVVEAAEADPDTLVRALVQVHAARQDRAGQPVDPVGSAGGQPTTAGGAGAVVAVWGPTGAPGRSTVALGVASGAAAAGIDTLLVDADVYGGATAQMLAVLDEVSGVLAAARAAASGGLDQVVLASAARSVSPRLRVLTGLPRADRWPALRPTAVREVLSGARSLATLVVVDCGFAIERDEELTFDTAAPQRNGGTVAVLEEADLALVVGSAEPLGLARLARARGELRELAPMLATRLVVNRVRPGLGWGRDEVRATLLRAAGEVPLGLLPLDQSAVDRAWSEGRPVREAVPASALARGLDDLAAEVVATVAPHATATVRQSPARAAGPRRRRVRR